MRFKFSLDANTSKPVRCLTCGRRPARGYAEPQSGRPVCRDCIALIGEVVDEGGEVASLPPPELSCVVCGRCEPGVVTSGGQLGYRCWKIARQLIQQG